LEKPCLPRRRNESAETESIISILGKGGITALFGKKTLKKNDPTDVFVSENNTNEKA
jgi:hypothetical protein